MTTVAQGEPRIKPLKALNRLVLNQPQVDIIEDDGQGCAWLTWAGEWLRIVSVKNLWDIDCYNAGEKRLIRMHFLVVVENGSQMLLFRDLIDGSWYREDTLGSGNKTQLEPIS